MYILAPSSFESLKFNQVAVEHTVDGTTWEAEAVRSLWVRGQADLQSKFQDSQGYTVKPWNPVLKDKTNQNNTPPP